MSKGKDSTRERRATLLKIIEGTTIADQHELRRRLARAGHEVTQPSISRDLTALGIIKAQGRYRAPAPLPGIAPELTGAVVRVRSAGPNMLVLKTLPGRAQLVGLEIDRILWPEVAGTVAGDDTVFVALTGRNDQKIIEARLAPLLAHPST